MPLGVSIDMRLLKDLFGTTGQMDPRRLAFQFGLLQERKVARYLKMITFSSKLVPTKHGYLEHTYAYRFTAKSDGRVFAFGGDGTYSPGLAAAAKDADILFVEGITRKNVKFAAWGVVDAHRMDTRMST